MSHQEDHRGNSADRPPDVEPRAGEPPDDFLGALDGILAAELLDGASGEDETVEGQLCGRYRIRRLLGRGAMGIVYLAHDPDLDRPVALKLLPHHLGTDPTANRRLVEEARAASALDHPHIATVYEIGESDDGRLFLAMAYYGGGTLRSRLTDGPLPVGEAISVASQIADGLSSAHAKGIVHRDIKPENLIFAENGGAKILDFGIAKAAAALTATGRVRGTAAYMSPEQSKDRADQRTDIWSLGVVLYEMLTGRRPFESELDAGLVAAIRNDPPPPLRQLRPEAPEALARVVERCLEKDPERRYASAADLAEALRDAMDIGDRGERSRSPARRRGPRRVGLAAVLLTLTAIAFTASVLRGTFGIPGPGGIGGDGPHEPGRVLVAEFEAAGEAAEVSIAAREALAVDLTQSRFLSVVSRAEIAEILRQMALPDTTRLDLPLALEVGERAGAGAVLAASVTRLGPEFVFSGRAVRPSDGEDLFAVRTSARAHGLLEAVERLSRGMRGYLGETQSEIARSRPLPAVSTGSLPALRLYAEADRLLSSRPDAAAGLLAEALQSDPDFAMAHRMAAAIAYTQLRMGDARAHLIRAYELRDRVGERERWHIEAMYHAAVSLEAARAAEAFEMLLHRDPNDWRAAFNVAGVYQSWLDDHETAYGFYRRAAESNPHTLSPIIALLQAGMLAGRESELDSLEVRAVRLGGAEAIARWRPLHAFAVGEYARAAALCDTLLSGPPNQSTFADDRELCGAFDVASGRLRQGLLRLEQAERSHLEAGRYRNASHAGQAIVLAHALRGEPVEAVSHLDRLLTRIPADAVAEPDRFILRTNLQLQAALLGRTDVMDRIAAAYPRYPDPDHWLGQVGDALVRAARHVQAEEGDAALRILRAGWPADRDAIGWRIWKELLYGMAFEQVEQPDSAAVRYALAADPRYHTLPYLTKNRIYLPVALAQAAAAAEAAGDTAGAAGARRRLLYLSSAADPEVIPDRIDGSPWHERLRFVR